VSTPIVGRRGVEGVSLLIRDLREQLKLSGALSASEAFNRSVLEASPDCTKVLTADGALRYMNLNGQCALGIDDFRKLEGQKWETLWPEESREAVNTALREAVAGAESRFTAYCPRPTGAARWWDVIVRPVLDDDGKCVAVVATSRDVSEQRAAQVELARRERQLRLALDAGQLGTFSYSFDADRVEWDDRARAMFEAGEARGADLFRLFDSLHADDRQRARAAFDRASTPSSDGRFYFEGRIDPGGATVRWLETRGVVQFEDGEAGRRPVFAHAVSRDCTIERLDAERRAVLGRELAHRVKNAFAVAQSIVNRSISNATTLEEAREAIIGRIGALSVSQASLSGDVTEGGRLEAVVKAMLELFGARATVKGPDILLTPKATETFGLVVHELATNAAKHGALSNERGSIDVVWSIDDSSSPPRFEFVWRERDGPSPAAVNRKGFGSTILTRVAAAEFQCRPRQSFHPEGMEYTFSAPLPALGRLGLNRDVKISLRSPRLRALFQVWAECERKDGTTLGALVAKNSWDPLAMALAEKDNDGNIAFISVRGPAEALSAGWFAPNGQPSEQFRNFYLACAESGEPCHEFARFDFGEGPSFSLERLALPLPKCKQDSVVVVGFVDFEGRADPGLEDDGRIVDLMEDD
jgi:PAS domain S-box-containing protein